MKDKLDGEEAAPVRDSADTADAAQSEADDPVAQQRGEAAALKLHLDAQSVAPAEPDPTVAQDHPTDLMLPAPGLPDAPLQSDFAAEPIQDAEPHGETWLAAGSEAPAEPEAGRQFDADPRAPERPQALHASRAETTQTISAGFDAQATLAVASVLPGGEAPFDEIPVETAPEGGLGEESPAEYLPLADVEPKSAERPTSLDALAGRTDVLPGATPTEQPFPQDAPAETSSEAPLAEPAGAEHPAIEEPSVEIASNALPAEMPAEPPTEQQPLRERIPRVSPVQLEAIKTPLAVPVFEPPARRPEIAQPTRLIPTRAAEATRATAAYASAAVAASRSVDDVATARPSAADIAPYLRRALRLAVIAAVTLGCVILALIVLYRWVNPPASTLMLGQWLTGTRIDQRWVPIGRMSPYLHRAVITSEDGRFCRHHGVDWGEIEEAIERARDGVPRGGSTITMQLVKNLFLWPSKSYLRKALEIPLSYLVELAWPKRRILEVYLNIAEWGPGIFGAEAAARYHFGKPAASLTPSQAALLAVSLPNPLERSAGAPGPGTLRLASTLHARMMASAGNAACVQAQR